jgi:rhamnulokinase
MDAVFARLPRERIFAQTGIQFLPFNTIYQLAAHVRDGLPAGAARLLMMPDLCHHFLCGARTGEYTNATTTQLLNARTHKWDDELFLQLGLPRALMPPLVQPGADLGTLRAARQAEVGGPAIRVIAPATHDTASAVLGTPLEPGWAYVSSGTWSLVGVELLEPRLDAAVAAANFTNEGGAFGTVRFLRNVMGLWLLEACRKEWGPSAPGIETLVSEAAARPRPAGVIDPDDPRFLNPRSMTEAIRHRLASTGQEPPDDPGGFARVIFDSLALRYAAVVDEIERLTGDAIPGIHIVGGGSQNRYLNQATADASGRPVAAGPVEAAAAGNVLVQAMASGELGSLVEARAQLARSVALQRYEPQRRDRWWHELAARQSSLSR